MPTTTARALTLAILLPCLHADAQRIDIEGESYARVGGPSKIRILERKGTYGGKVVSYWEEPGVWLEWDFEIPRTGSYCISIRYACRWPDTTRRIEIDGKLPHKVCTAVRFAGTGDWAAWRFHTLCDEDGVPIQFQLAEGKHRIRMTNVDSRGLAVDVIVLHDPQWPLDDVVVGGEAASKWRPVFDSGTYQRTRHQTLIARGSVRVTLDPESACESARAASTLFSVWLRGLEPTTKQAFPPISVSVVGSGHAARLGACLLRINRRWQVVATDGIALYVIFGDAGRELRSIPLTPLIYSQAGRLRHAVTWRTDAGALYVRHGGVRASPSMDWRVGASRVSVSHPWEPQTRSLHVADGVRVAAVKIGPPEWSEKGLEVKVESKGNRDIVHSSAQDFPALAAFYGYGRFTVEFEWGEDLKRCVLNDLASGESVVLWPPKGGPKP